MELVTEVTVSYLGAQIEAGAQAVQLFDSWVGWLSPYDYERFALPYARRAVAQVRGRGAPVIYFANGAGGMLPQVRQTGADVYGLDWRVSLDKAWDELGHDVAVQGTSTPPRCSGRRRPSRSGRPTCCAAPPASAGHVFNLGHGILPETDPEHVKYLVDAVHRLSARGGGDR